MRFRREDDPMLLDDSAFPIVRMHYDKTAPEGEDAGFALFDALLARERAFVLLGEGGDGAREQSHEERKSLTLWMKRNREPLRAFVKAMVYVEPKAAKRVLVKASAGVFGKFWGYPMLVAASREEALAIAARLLAGEPPSAIDAEEPDA
jgi:hypothetical protein